VLVALMGLWFVGFGVLVFSWFVCCVFAVVVGCRVVVSCACGLW